MGWTGGQARLRCAALIMLAAGCSSETRGFEGSGGATSGSGAGAGGSGAGCPEGLSACGGGCVDPRYDPQHCGGCDQACAPGLACLDGACVGGGATVCTPGAQEVCFSGPAAALGMGACQAGIRTCAADGAAWGACVGEVVPVPEQCSTAADDDCNGTANEACGYARCGEVPAGSPSGVYMLDLDGAGPQAAFGVYCDLVTDGGGWALVYNSVGSTLGTTTAFWAIPYAERLGVKGTPGLETNFYAGALYVHGMEYRDDIEDLLGTIAVALEATAAGIQATTMHFLNPTFIGGNSGIYQEQFSSGWSSPDFDGDAHSTDNCATAYNNVTQHYGNCWTYNIGADPESNGNDNNWGPHLHSPTATVLSLYTDGSVYTRVKRISRWTRW